MTHEQEIKYRTEALWRDIDAMLQTAEHSGRVCAEMLRGKSLPLLTSDLPTSSWQRISEAIMAIAQLKQVDDTVKQAEFWSTKKKRSKRRTPAGPVGAGRRG